MKTPPERLPGESRNLAIGLLSAESVGSGFSPGERFTLSRTRLFLKNFASATIAARGLPEIRVLRLR
jgi:hypothetical protein